MSPSPTNLGPGRAREAQPLALLRVGVRARTLGPKLSFTEVYLG
jgi:hypothetical protein